MGEPLCDISDQLKKILKLMSEHESSEIESDSTEMVAHNAEIIGQHGLENLDDAHKCDWLQIAHEFYNSVKDGDNKMEDVTCGITRKPAEEPVLTKHGDFYDCTPLKTY